MLRHTKLAIIAISLSANMMIAYHNSSKQSAMHRRHGFVLGSAKRHDEFNIKNSKITKEYIQSEREDADIRMIEQMEQLCKEYPSVIQAYNTRNLSKAEFERKIKQDYIDLNVSLREEEIIVNKYIENPELSVDDMTTELVFLSRPQHKMVLFDYVNRDKKIHKTLMTEEELQKSTPMHQGSSYYLIPTQNIWYEEKKQRVIKARTNNKKYTQFQEQFKYTEDLD